VNDLLHIDAIRTLRDRLPMLPTEGSERQRADRLRALLEEVGIGCDETAQLEGIDAALIGSKRGTDALIAARLTDAQKLAAYARLIARLLSGEMHGPIDLKMEYADAGDAPSRREREEERMVLALASAIADGRLDLAPRPMYEDVPRKLTLAFTPRSAARSTLGGFHWWSDFWYRRSNMYRRWRSRRDVSAAIGRVCVILTRASFPAA
jgi:hypothetical protein